MIPIFMVVTMFGGFPEINLYASSAEACAAFAKSSGPYDGIYRIEGTKIEFGYCAESAPSFEFKAGNQR